MIGKYNYFVSFAQQKKDSHGFGWRILGFNQKVTIMDLQEALENGHPEFIAISIINFKLITKDQVRSDGKESKQ